MRDVNADSARADDGDALAHRRVAQQNVGVRHDVGKIAPLERDATRHYACCEHDAVESAQLGRIADAPPQMHDGSEPSQLVGVVANRLVEIAFARNASRHAELAAELVLCFEELDGVSERG